MESLLGFLFVFCAVMAAIAVGRAVVSEEMDPVAVGSALLTVAITLGVLLWLGIESNSLTEGLVVGLGGSSLLLAATGIGLMIRHWE
ncbi:hypothetical protein OB905_00620 [Halobacteria archaeon AArc-dxtr1]|nr:hypothetical protein [Halobacteria archaeon AArc-dxtr1]